MLLMIQNDAIITLLLINETKVLVYNSQGNSDKKIIEADTTRSFSFT